MPAVGIASWAGVGLLVGAALAVQSGQLLTSAQVRPLVIQLAGPLVTASLFGCLAWRVGPTFDLLPYSVLAVVGVALGVIDILERRLPSRLVYPGIVGVGALLATSAVLHSRGPDLLRALAATAVLAAFYLVLALASGGGLGAGDVKLGGLLGLTLGWMGWSTLLIGVFLGWSLAAVARLALRLTRRIDRDSTMPLGPFLLAGAFVALLVAA
jgi:leader peptidase (prepilin peptidase)/N-methyltransferase